MKLLVSPVVFLALGAFLAAPAQATPPSETGPQVVQSHVERIYATANPKLDVDGRDDERVDVDVAVLDTGIKLDHKDLNIVGRTDCTAATAKAEYKCTSASPDDGDDNEAGAWHGTWSAANLAALDNDIGLVGIAPGARLWAVDVHGDEVFDNGPPIAMSLEAMIAGLRWVTERADQIEIAYLLAACATAQGTPEPQPTCADDKEGTLVKAFEAEVKKAIDAGVVVVSASGNWNQDTATLVPQRLEGMLIVSGMTDTDGKPGGKGSSSAGSAPCAGSADDTSWGANWGDEVDVTAPGCPTSATGPQLAGAAAILASKKDPQKAEDVAKIGEEIFGDGVCPDNVGEANCEWTDNSGDGKKEPLLDVGDQVVFNPQMAPGSNPNPDSDVDGDGRGDLVALRANGVVYAHGGGADFKFGTGVSSFSGKPLGVAQYDGSGHYAIDLADVDGDTQADLVTLADDGDVHVYEGKGDKTFDETGVESDLNLTPALLAPGGHEPIAVADVDGDRRADLITHDGPGTAVMVYPGKADSSFGTGVKAQSSVSSALHSGSGHQFVDAADVTGDGRADLVSLYASGLRVFAGKSNGTFEAPITSQESAIDPAMADGSGYEPVGLADVTGDRKTDLLLVKSGTLYTYPAQSGGDLGKFGSSKANFAGALASTTFGSGAVEYIGSFDVDGNGRADLIGRNASTNAIQALAGQTDGSFTAGATSAGTFPSTQHFKNQTSSGNEFAGEKPSWRRRGCDPQGCLADPVWHYEGETIKKATEIDLSGEISLNGQWFPVVCDIDGDATLLPGGKGQITRFDLSGCNYMYGGGYCEGGQSISSTVPWPIHASENESSYPQMLIDDMSFTVEITALPCTAKPKFSVTNADITATGQSPSSPIDIMDFSGENQGQSKHTIEGELEIDPSETIGVTEG